MDLDRIAVRDTSLAVWTSRRRLLAGGAIALASLLLVHAREGEGKRNKPQKKVVLCHKGKTLEVAANAVDAHTAHGDNLGPCLVVPPPTETPPLTLTPAIPPTPTMFPPTPAMPAG